MQFIPASVFSVRAQRRVAAPSGMGSWELRGILWPVGQGQRLPGTSIVMRPRARGSAPAVASPHLGASSSLPPQGFHKCFQQVSCSAHPISQPPGLSRRLEWRLLRSAGLLGLPSATCVPNWVSWFFQSEVMICLMCFYFTCPVV